MRDAVIVGQSLANLIYNVNSSAWPSDGPLIVDCDYRVNLSFTIG